MIPTATLTAARTAIARTFLYDSAGEALTPGQLRFFTKTGPRSDDGTWSNEGDPIACCLYRPKGTEIPQPLAMLNRTMFWLSWDVDEWPLTPQKRVIVEGVEYEVHDVPTERTNRFLPTAMVSRLK